MDFGIPTLIENASIEDCAELCQELNLQFIELSMDLPEYQSERIDADHFSEIAERYGVYYTMHLHGRLNPCDVNSRIAKAYTDTALQAIETVWISQASITAEFFWRQKQPRDCEYPRIG